MPSAATVMTGHGWRTSTPTTAAIARTNRSWPSVRLQRLAQAADVDVDGALFHVHAAAPHVVEQLGAGVHALGVGHEEMQQAVFGGADLHRGILGEHAVR